MIICDIIHLLKNIVFLRLGVIMRSFAEKPFTINGVKSWIHCLDCYQPGSPDEIRLYNYHYHDYIEFLYAVDAEMTVWMSGVPHKLETGDLIVINSGEMHTLSFNKNSRYICVKFSPRVLYFDDNSLFEFKYVTPFLSGKTQHKLFRQSDFENIDIHKLCFEILEEWNEHRPAYELSIRANILKIFTGIFRYWEKENLFHSDRVIAEPIKRALLYISENIDTVTERDAAASCGFSYNHFSALFNKSVGRSFNDYVILLRLNEAERLIISSNKSITEIAYSCGFASTSHFIARFKAIKGVTPGQLRKRVR